MAKFDVSRFETWINASFEKQVSWKDTTFFDIDTGKNISELKMVSFLSQMLVNIQENTSKEKMDKYGINKTIELIMDNLMQKIDASKICSDISEIINKKSNTLAIFDILDQATWNKATDNDFFWKGESVINEATDKPLTEREIIAHFRRRFEAIEKGRSPMTEKEKTDYIDKFFEQAIKDAQRKDSHKEFDIFDFDSWNFATNKPYYWKDSMLFSPEKKIITEKDLVDFFEIMFKFLERKGQKMTLDKKIVGITTVLDRMKKYQSDPSIMDLLDDE